MLILKAPQSEVLAALQKVAGIAPARSTLVIATHLLIRKSGDMLAVTATDMDTQASAVFDGLGGEAGEFATAVSAKRIQDVLKAVPPDQVVSLTAKDSKLTLQAGKSRFTMQTLPAEGFPLSKAADDEAQTYSLPQRALLSCLQQVGFAMGVNHVQFYLNGALLSVTDGTLNAVATDTARMAYTSVAVEGAPDCQTIIPREAVLQLIKMIAPTDAAATVRLTRNQAVFTFDGMEFITKVIDGRFPDFRRVMAAKLPQSLTLGRGPFLRALKTVSVMTDDKFKAVRLKFASGLLHLSAAGDGGEDAETELEVDYGGQDMELGFNAKLLGEGLSSVDDDMVRVDFGAEAHLTISLPSGAPFRYVVSPLRI